MSIIDFHYWEIGRFDRFEDGCSGCRQMICFQVTHIWIEMNKDKMLENLENNCKVIIRCLDASVKYQRVFEKFKCWKSQNNKLIILNDFDFETKTHEHIKIKIREKVKIRYYNLPILHILEFKLN